MQGHLTIRDFSPRIPGLILIHAWNPNDMNTLTSVSENILASIKYLLEKQRRVLSSDQLQTFESIAQENTLVLIEQSYKMHFYCQVSFQG